MEPSSPPSNPARSSATDCIFCRFHDPEINTIMIDGTTAYVRVDNFPAARGHVEIIPKRHVESYFDLTRDEHTEIHDLAKQIRQQLDEQYRPDGYTIGVNEGRAAGRTIDHLHLHVIPRYKGDVPDPRGGIRHVLPGTDPDQWQPQNQSPRPAVDVPRRHLRQNP
ncbi:HIT family protein [Amycolatopsis orientalis]|uniref:HIT family protein n=1 Tax=Amycolatopsis orientalis TaxID=31958 RepID=UPI00042773E5|nr:HIT domain-containing protein [Amycolatopsis orientalis]